MFEISLVEPDELFSNTKLPAKPIVFFLLLDFLKDLADPEKVNTEWLGNIISSDKELIECVIKAANAVNNYTLGHVKDVNKAISILGIQNTLKVITIHSFNTIGIHNNNSASEIWNHSFYIAILIACISRDLSIGVHEEAYLFGLLHDCGTLLMHLWFEEDYEETLLIASRPGQSLIHIENDRHNTNHAIAGATLAKHWGFDDVICQAIRYHHDIDALHSSQTDISDKSKKLIALGNLAVYSSIWYGDIDSPIANNESTVFIDKSLQFLNIGPVDLENGLNRLKIQINDISQFATIKRDKLTDINKSYLDYYDSLTGLPNQLILYDRVQQAILFAKRHNKILAVICLELIEYQSIVQQNGQKIADATIVSLSQKIVNCVRKTDSVIRIEDDQFIILLNELDEIDAVKAPLKKLLSLHNIEEVQLSVNLSIGISFFTPAQHDAAFNIDQLLQEAIEAKNDAKQKGKTSFQIYEQNKYLSHKTTEQPISIVDALKQEQFLLHYQPKVNMLTGQLIGAEALIRWHHPSKGILSPDSFLPQLINQPESIDLDNWVINAALCNLSQWQLAGLDLPISINIYLSSLKQEHLITHFKQMMAKYPNIKPGNFKLELVEDHSLFNHQQLNEIIVELKALGIGFILDNFGMGETSFTSLSSLSVNSLTLDKSFVAGIDHNPESLAIIRSIITLASIMKRRVVAKGIETIEQGEALLKAGCIYGQGYIIAKPMLSDEFLKWKDNWKPDRSWRRRKSWFVF